MNANDDIAFWSINPVEDISTQVKSKARFLFVTKCKFY